MDGMLTALFAIALFFFFILVLYFSSKRISRKESHSVGRRSSGAWTVYVYGTVPADLGARNPDLLRPVLARLDAALPDSYREQVKMRLMRERSGMTDAAFDWHWFEMKRYFVMNAMLPYVPMFSGSVDDVWHEMLMFTREYGRFGEKFFGSMLHHAPHAGKKELPNDRAWFDLIYTKLFEPAAHSARLWGTFFKYPLHPDLIDDLRDRTETELIEQRFNRDAAERFPDVESVIVNLIQELRNSVRDTDELYRSGVRPQRESSIMLGCDSLAMAMLFYSAYDYNHYDHNMDQYVGDAQRKDQSSSSCGAGYVSSCSSDSNDGGSNGDAGDSGGSSCGGGSGCSGGSGCGGGGD